MNTYPHLFSPVKVGSALFRNRIFASPTGVINIKSDKTLDDDATLYYERKAIGGAAAVCVGECQVDPRRGSRGGVCIDLTDFRSTFFMAKIADKISRHGAVASAELSHCGRYGASGLGPSEGDVDGRITPAMTEQDILETIEAYGKAAAHAKMRGFGMVTVHGGHGWLPEQFFSPYVNKRTDRWGGSLENRARFAVAICDAIHEKCGRDFPVEFRISATELEQGYGLSEGIEYAMALDGHADIIHVSAGVHGTLSNDGWLVSSPGIFTEEGALVPYAADVKKHVKKSLVATVGSLTDPEMMEEIIASGKADFIAMARGLLCDPDLPVKAQSGRTSDIRTCLRCMSCWSNLMSGGIYCAVNPKTYREAETAYALPPAERKTVLIAGGGIAGMQAALTAAENGQQVILCEKTSSLGGGIGCERNVPFKKHIDGYIQLQERLIRRAGVEIRLGTEVTMALASELKPDVLIAAVGSRPVRPAIEGIDGGNVLSAQTAFSQPERIGKKAVIIGAGLAGCELAVYLNMLGHDVEIIEMGSRINAEGLQTQGTVVSRELRIRGIPVRFGATATRITPEGLEYEGTGGTGNICADSVICAAGQAPLYEDAMKLAGCAPIFHMLGDCAGAKNIFSAVKTAYTIARDIGRY